MSMTDGTAGKKKVVGAGAAVFALGLFLGGPQATGVAAADSGEDNSSNSASAADSDSTPTSKRGTTARGATRSTPVDGPAAGPARSVRGTATTDAVPPVTTGRAPRAIADTAPRAVADTVPPAAAEPAPRAADSVPAPVRRGASEVNQARPAVAAASEVVADNSGDTAVTRVVPDAVPAMVLGAAADSAVSAEPLQAPVASAAPKRTAAASTASAVSVNATGTDWLGEAVQNFFGTLTDWLHNLPPNQLITNLEGALLLVRRTFFNLDPIASPVQTSYNPEDLTQQITGTVGAEDPEGETLAFAVVEAPRFGTVEVFDNGKYVYTPGDGFAGRDTFDVLVTPTAHVADPIAGFIQRIIGMGSSFDKATKVTVLVGEDAPTNPFGDRNIRDVALFLGSIPVILTVDRKNPLTGVQRASVALRASDDYPVTWLDDQGHIGQISVNDLAGQWDGFESAGNVRLGVEFEMEDFSAGKAIMTSVKASYLPESGLYVFSGVLAADPVDGDGVDTHYDITGESAKAKYQNFRTTYLDVANFDGLDLYIDAADVYADSYSVRDYEKALQGTDPGIAITAAEGPALAAALAGVSVSSSAVNAILPYGQGSFVTGLGTGEVKLWNGRGWVSLAALGSPVQTMMAYRDGFVVGLNNGSVYQWSAAADVTDGLSASAFSAYSAQNVTPPQGEGAAQAFDNSVATKYLNFAGPGSGVTVDMGLAAVVTGLNLTTANDAPNRDPASYEVYGSSDGKAFTQIASGVLTPPAERQAGYEAVSFANATPYRFYRVVFPTVSGEDGGQGCATACMQIAEIGLPGTHWTQLQGAGWNQPISTMMAYGDGFVVGLGGSTGGVNQVRYWTGTEWRELQGSKWAQPISTMMAYGDGFVVGLGGSDKGGVWQYTGKPADGGGWKVLHDTGWAQPVSAMTAYGDGFVVGLGGAGKGGVFQFTGTTTTGGQSTWKTLHGTGWAQPVNNIITYGEGLVVGLGANGKGGVWQWTGTTTTGTEKDNWTALQDQGWKQPVNTLMPYGGGFVVGLGSKGAVEYWDKHTVDDVTDILGTTFSSVPTDDGRWISNPLFVRDKSISPKGEGVYEAFDNSFNTKYLNRGGRYGPGEIGSGARIFLPDPYAINGLALYTGSDSAQFQQRDPVSYRLEGLDPYKGWIPVSSGALQLPVSGTVAYPPVSFDNTTPYKTYRLTFPELRGSDPCGETANSCMQVAEIELQGVAAKPGWKELQGAGWASAVTAMIPFEGGFLVGLANGAVEKWTPGDGDDGQWQEFAGNQIPLTEESLAAAIKRAKDEKKPFVDGTFDPNDPLFADALLQPKCMADLSCNGSFYPLTSYSKPSTLLGASKSFALGAGTSIDLSYNAGTTVYGYVYVPGGLWAKLKPSNYAGGLLTAVTTGPSLTVNLGDGKKGVLNAEPFTLVGPSTLAAYPPFVELSGKIDASITAEFQMPEDKTKTKLVSDFYYTAGLLTTLNVAKSNGFQFGYAGSGPTLNYEDFKLVQGLTITPSLIPSLTVTGGVFTPSSTPIIGKLSLVALGLTYANPVSVSVTLPLATQTDWDLRFSSKGTLDFTAGVLPELTSALTYESSTLEVYTYTSGNLLAPSTV